jgi:hypothetical protein
MSSCISVDMIPWAHSCCTHTLLTTFESATVVFKLISLRFFIFGLKFWKVNKEASGLIQNAHCQRMFVKCNFWCVYNFLSHLATHINLLKQLFFFWKLKKKMSKRLLDATLVHKNLIFQVLNFYLECLLLW